MFDHLADLDPPTGVDGVRERIAQRLRRRRRHQMVGGAFGAVALATAIGVLVASTSGGTGSSVFVDGSPTVGRTRPSPDASLLTVVSTRPQVTYRTIAHRRFRFVDYRGTELQERSLRSGRVEAVLLRTSSRDQISASFMPNGDVLVGVSGSPNCGATLLSIDPSTGSSRTVAHLPESIEGLGGLTVSPDGRFVAYLAYPGCQGDAPVPTTIARAGSTSSITPDYLAIRDLGTGVTHQAPLQEEGDAFGNDGPVWSPDGRRLALASSLSTTILSAADPSLAGASVVRPPAHCYVDAIGAWAAEGITESLQCTAPVLGRYDPRHPPATWSLLEQVVPSGQTSNRLRLSSCDGIDSIDSIDSSTPGSVVVVDAVNRSIAVGSTDPCHAPTTRIATFAGGQLHTVLSATSEIDLPG